MLALKEGVLEAEEEYCFEPSDSVDLVAGSW